MSEFMERILTVSAQAGIFILCILLISWLTKKHISPRLRYAMWLLPAVRLLIPIRFESALSFISLAKRSVQPAAIVNSGSLPTDAVNSIPVQAASPVPAQAAPIPAAVNAASNSAAPDIMSILFWVWLIGAAAVIIYMLVVNINFYIKVNSERNEVDMSAKPPVYSMSGLASPCLCGYFKPMILMNEPALKDESVYGLVLRHELSHFYSGDQWWALIRNICCAVHWFNPIVWWAAFRCRADCELACDARVMEGFTQQQCESYGMALLSIIKTGGRRKAIAYTTTAMAGGKRALKERVRFIGDRPRAAWYIALGALIILLAAGLIACSDAKTNRSYSQTLIKQKVKYIGDAPALGELMNSIDFPGDLVAKGGTFRLETNNEPYGLHFIFNVEEGGLEPFESGEYTAEMYKSALTLFALIDNMGQLQISLTDHIKAVEYQFSRDFASYIVGGDISAYSSSADALQALLNMQIDPSAYENGAYILTKLEYGKEMQTIQYPMSVKANEVCAAAVGGHTKSAASKGPSIAELPVCYRVKAINANIQSAVQEHYFYMQDADSAIPVGQAGADGYYSTVDPDKYDALTALFTNAKMQPIPAPAFPLSDAALNAALKETGLAWQISDVLASTYQEDFSLTYSLHRPQTREGYNGAFINSFQTDRLGRRLKVSYVESQDLEYWLREDDACWEDWHDVIVLATRLYGGFENAEAIYQACSKNEMPKDTTVLWEGSVTCNKATCAYVRILTSEPMKPERLKWSNLVHINIYESPEHYQIQVQDWKKTKDEAAAARPTPTSKP